MAASMPVIEERVDRLEDSIDRFITSVGIEFNKLYNSQMQTQMELRAFKDEMKDFKDEMSDFKDEMLTYKDENRQQIREMNRQWGEISNKLGTMVEDLVYPSLPRIIHDVLGLEPERIWARLKQKLLDGRVREFDAVALIGELVCLNSTKATLRSADVDSFIQDIDAFREFFPEYAERPVIGVLATLAVDESVLSYAETTGFLVLAVGDEIMEVKNHRGFEPKRWR